MAARPLGKSSRIVAGCLALILSLAATPVVAASTSGLGAPTALTVDNMAAPIGLGLHDVFFGWQVSDTRAGAVQAAYRILVSRPSLGGRVRDVVSWDSGRIDSNVQSFVPYAGPALLPDTTYRWTVQTWDAAGNRSSLAPPATFDTGLADGDWHAYWIKRPTVQIDDTPALASLQNAFGIWLNRDEYTYVRKEARFSASPIVRARAYVSADQQYELYVNGSLAGKGQAYQFPDAQYYETQDITSLLHPGAANAFGLVYNWQGPGKGRPPGTPGVIARISVLHRDGTHEVLTTDGTWRVLPGAWLPGTQRDEEGDPVDYTENINGLAEPVGWTVPGYLDVGWAPATVIGLHPTAPWTHLNSVRTRIAYEPVRAVSLTTLPSGAVVADFGKVYAGIPTVAFHQGVPGHLVTMHAGFLLDAPMGGVSTTHGTQHTDMSYSYVERAGAQTFRPFDYLGFRYLQLDDPGEHLSAKDVVLLARHTAVPDENVGTFNSSNAMVDAVFQLGRHSSLFTMQEQFVDTPTREKGAWLGDGRNESQTAMDVLGDVNLTRKDLLEFAQSQSRFWPDGGINKIYPTGLPAQEIPEGTAIYVDWVWFYWMHTGDRAALASLYPVVSKVADRFWRSVSPADGLVKAMPGAANVAQYPTDTTINVLAVNVFRRVGAMASALGRPEAEVAQQRRRQLALTAAVNTHLMGRTGHYAVGLDASGGQVPDPPPSLNAASAQSTNAYAILSGVVPPAQRAGIDAFVASLGMSTQPEFVGDLLEALRVVGDDRAMSRLLTDASQPGWANLLSRGGTFTWEVWNPVDDDIPAGGTPIGSFLGNGDSMSHGASANVSAAIQRSLLGVTPTSPGFASFDVTPPLHSLAFARGTIPTPRGTVGVQWQRRGAGFFIDVSVPANATASVHVPTAGRASVTAAGVGLAEVPGLAGLPGLAAASFDGQFTVVTVGAGTYHFESTGSALVGRLATRATPAVAPDQSSSALAPLASPLYGRFRVGRSPLSAKPSPLVVVTAALTSALALGLLLGVARLRRRPHRSRGVPTGPGRRAALSRDASAGRERAAISR